jgi:hypothetical protein
MIETSLKMAVVHISNYEMVFQTSRSILQIFPKNVWESFWSQRDAMDMGL